MAVLLQENDRTRKSLEKELLSKITQDQEDFRLLKLQDHNVLQEVREVSSKFENYKKIFEEFSIKLEMQLRNIEKIQRSKRSIKLSLSQLNKIKIA